MKATFVKNLSNLLENLSFRGKAIILHRLCPKVGIVATTLSGYEIKLDLSDYIQRSIFLNIFEPEESQWVKSFLKPGMTFVDVGANIGYFSLMAAGIVGDSGQVISFEPSPQAYPILEATINYNKISNISAVQAGLSDSNNNLQLFIPPVSHGNHSPSLIFADGWRPINVDVFRLDNYLIDHIDLIKIDVEGFEPNVIRGMSQFLKDKRVNAILIEFNQYWLNENKSGSKELYSEIIDYGFIPVSPLRENQNLQNIFFTLK